MERMVSQRLMPSEYYMATAWEWKQLNKVELGDLTYGNLCIDGTMAVLENTEAQPSEFDFKNMLYMGVRNGYMEQASYLYRAFRYNVQNFQGLFNLEEDGCIKARNVFEVEEVYSIASALFTNMLNSGRHVTQWIEDRITELYGKNSKEYQCWKRCTSAFFDESLAYALCDSLRNTAVHKALMLSVVNYRPDINMVGIALNIEAGMLLDSKLNGNLKKRIRAFRDERREAGLQPWLSIGSIVRAYDFYASYLYYYFLSILLDDIQNHMYMISSINTDRYTVLVLDPSHQKDYFSCIRSYRIVDSIDIDSSKRKIDAIIEHIREFDDELASELDAISSLNKV